MKYPALFLCIFLSFWSMSFASDSKMINEKISNHEYVELGKIKEVGKGDGTSNPYLLDTGLGLFDANPGGLSRWIRDPLHENGGYYARIGGFWEAGELLFIPIGADLRPSHKKIPVYNVNRDQIRLMQTIKILKR